MTESDPQAVDSERLAQNLTALTEFHEYFTDKEKINKLVDWLHDAGVNKLTARLAVQYLAPLLLARLQEMGAIVGQAWITVYLVASRIGLAQALDALEQLAGQLGMPDGMNNWAKLNNNWAKLNKEAETQD